MQFCFFIFVDEKVAPAGLLTASWLGSKYLGSNRSRHVRKRSPRMLTSSSPLPVRTEKMTRNCSNIGLSLGNLGNGRRNFSNSIMYLKSGEARMPLLGPVSWFFDFVVSRRLGFLFQRCLVSKFQSFNDPILPKLHFVFFGRY